MADSENKDYLEVDNPIAGQHSVCISFISPENTLTRKELFMFNKYMSQRCSELTEKVEKALENAPSEVRATLKDELVSELEQHMKYSYTKFASSFDDFKYKYNTQLEKQFNDSNDFKTSVRGVKVRGCYDTMQEAQAKAKELQRQDRSFHVFVGQIGYWLPWDPCADGVGDEEYLEEELNTMMKKYKENAVARDLLYEEEKREKLKAAMQEKVEAERKKKELDEQMSEPDPWLKSRFEDAPQTTDTGTTEATLAENTTESTVESGTNLQETTNTDTLVKEV